MTFLEQKLKELENLPQTSLTTEDFLISALTEQKEEIIDKIHANGAIIVPNTYRYNEQGYERIKIQNEFANAHNKALSDIINIIKNI